MNPVFGGEAIEGQKGFRILCQTLTGIGELLPVEGNKAVYRDNGLLPRLCSVDIMDSLFCSRLDPLRHLVAI